MYVGDELAVYTVREEAVTGFVTSYTLASGVEAEFADNGGTITNHKIPQTGDDAALTLWMILAGVSGALMIVLRKRRSA